MKPSFWSAKNYKNHN